MCARKGGLYPYVSTSNVFVKRPTPTLPVREGEWMRVYLDEGGKDEGRRFIWREG